MQARPPQGRTRFRRTLQFFEEYDVMLTDRGSEYCGNPERHE